MTNLYDKIMKEDYIAELKQNHDYMTAPNGIKKQIIAAKWPELNDNDINYIFTMIKYE